MLKSDLFAALDDISFTDLLPEEIESDIITAYEQRAGRSLSRADPVRLLLEVIAFVVILFSHKLDAAGKLNLLPYANKSFLDHLGALLGVRRNAPTRAVTFCSFCIAVSSTKNHTIPQGTRVSPDGEIFFATDEEILIPAGATEVTVSATCLTEGEIGNGYLPGQIDKIVDPFPFEISVRNIDTSNGGSDTESDEHFRERIQIAPESFSVAGPAGAYRYQVLMAHQDIIDVAVLGPAEDTQIQPGHVYIYPLLKGGELPSDELIQLVYETCNSDKTRPDTDFVHVYAPEVVGYALEVTYWIDRERAAQASQIRSAVENVISEWLVWQKSKLGRDINPSELTSRIIQAGAKRVEIPTPGFYRLFQNQIAVCRSQSVNYGGLEDG